MPEKPISMIRSSLLSTLLCEFILEDGRTLREVDYAPDGAFGGWRNFPYKREVRAILMMGRLIDRDTFKIPKEYFKGYAIHQVGMATPKMDNPVVAREIMVVQNDNRVYVCSYNICDKRWDDYTDDLKKPERPHLIKYDLSVHGM